MSFVTSNRKYAFTENLPTNTDERTLAKLMGADFEVQKVQNMIRRLNPPSVAEFLESNAGMPTEQLLKAYERTYFEEALNFTTRRDDTGGQLGSVGKQYTTLQNKEMLQWTSQFVQQVDDDSRFRGTAYTAGGVIKGGRQVFVVLRMPQRFVVKGVDDDIVRSNFMVLNGHDGKGSLKLLWVPTRLACDNELPAILKTAKAKAKQMKGNFLTTNMMSIRHTVNIQHGMDNAMKFLGLIDARQESLKEELDHWASVPMNDGQALHYYSRLAINDKGLLEKVMHYPAKQFTFGKLQSITVNDGDNLKKVSPKTLGIINGFMKARTEGRGQAGIEGTLWGVYNGATYVLTREGKSEDATFDNLYGGTNARNGQLARTYTLATSLA